MTNSRQSTISSAEAPKPHRRIRAGRCPYCSTQFFEPGSVHVEPHFAPAPALAQEPRPPAAAPVPPLAPLVDEYLYRMRLHGLPLTGIARDALHAVETHPEVEAARARRVAAFYKMPTGPATK